MSRAASYATAEMGNKTMVEDVLDLNGEQGPSQLTRKFIRETSPARNIGVQGYTDIDTLENYQSMNPINHQQTHPGMMDPSRGGAGMYALPPPNNHSDSKYIHMEPEPNNPNMIQENYNNQVSVAKEELTVSVVANRIFINTADFIDALDNNKHSLHIVAKSMLRNKISPVDKTIYISIIVLLSLIIAFLLYHVCK